MNARRTAVMTIAAALALALTSAPAGAVGTGGGPSAVPVPTTPGAGPSTVGLTVPHARTGPSAVRATVDVIVHLTHPSARPGIVAAARVAGVPSGRAIPALGVESFAVPQADASAFAARLRATRGVDSVHVAQPLRLAAAPNDPDYTTYQAPYLNTVHALAGWEKSHGSSGVVIAVVDTGVRTTHQDLASKVLVGYNALNSTSDVTDSFGHGTFVAGIAGAATNNGVGVAGVGWATSILPVKVATGEEVAISDAAAGIVWAADHGATIINCSFGGPADATLQSAVQYAQGKGVLLVASAGNTGDTTNAVEYPAAYPGVIGVGATTATGHAVSWSQHGSWVTVAAPGVDIASTYYTGDAAYGSGDGTSFASPIVAGEAALLKAFDPAASAADLRTAIVNSATALPGEGMGAGRVDIAAAFDHLPPTSVPTITAPVDAATVSGGAVTLSATSSAPKVQFAVSKPGDGPHLVGKPVAVSAGTASTTWSSYGFDGAWSVLAFDCTATDDCVSSGATIGVTVTNDAPVVTGPASGDAITGGYTVSATTAGGGVRWLVDGAAVAFDGTAPYSAFVAVSLADGPHSVVAVQCDATGARCEGPSSAPVPFTSTSLHPTITAAAPTPFSPNGDKRRDTATTTYRLDRSSSVRVTVVNGAGATMYSHPLGTLAAGLHAVVITGRTPGGTAWPDGSYTVQILTSAVVNAAALRGAASRSVRIDNHPPSLSSSTVPPTTFYPVKDGYRDYFGPSAVPSETGSMSLIITTARGAAVTTITAAVTGGRAKALSWNGRTSKGKAVAAGRYVWRLMVQDVAGNRRYSIARSEYVSLKHLVLKSATVTVAGSSRYKAGTVNGLTCANALTGSSFTGGLRLVNNCNPGTDGSESSFAAYSIKVPGAVSYKDLSVRSTGFSHYFPSYIDAEVYNNVTGWTTWPNGWRTIDSAIYTLPFGTGSAGSVVSSTGRVAVAILLSNVAGSPPYDWDIKNVSITISYRVLG
jgi:subtilisin family serine protease/flagellar hook assembly protein FlgD